MKQLLDADGLAGAWGAVADAIAAAHRGGPAPAIIGVRTRGEPLARRLAGMLVERGTPAPDLGFLDITMYRDDLAGRGGRTTVGPTEIAFDLDGRQLILVDDVLFTGRSVRAALDALVDFGRPARIRLAVLVDRGGRELPIQADYLGLRAEVPAGGEVRVRLRETDGADEVVVDSK